jgi:hypothetical protein
VLPNSSGNKWRRSRHHTAKRDTIDTCLANESQQLPFRLAVKPSCRRDVRLPHHTLVIGQPDVRVRVPDVEE